MMKKIVKLGLIIGGCTVMSLAQARSLSSYKRSRLSPVKKLKCHRKRFPNALAKKKCFEKERKQGNAVSLTKPLRMPSKASPAIRKCSFYKGMKKMMCLKKHKQSMKKPYLIKRGKRPFMKRKTNSQTRCLVAPCPKSKPTMIKKNYGTVKRPGVKVKKYGDWRDKGVIYGKPARPRNLKKMEMLNKQ